MKISPIVLFALTNLSLARCGPADALHPNGCGLADRDSRCNSAVNTTVGRTKSSIRTNNRPRNYIVVYNESAPKGIRMRKARAVHNTAIQVSGNDGLQRNFNFQNFSGSVVHMDPDTADAIRQDIHVTLEPTSQLANMQT
jgi:hypothetical protein